MNWPRSRQIRQGDDHPGAVGKREILTQQRAIAFFEALGYSIE
jgi:hypothetical protein